MSLLIVRLPIDLKSLYLNIKNDNKTGHTATVATPLRQGNSIHKEIAQILTLPSIVPPDSFEDLSLHLISNSRAEAKIVQAFLFDNISVNGIPVNCQSSFCVYIREEIDPNNVHYGRQKVHYPQKLKYEDANISIDNNEVIKAISATLHDYAFIVQALEYDESTHILNFDALIVGEKNIPYSKVFLNKRGVGEKFSLIFNVYADLYDSEIIAMRRALGYDAVNPDNFMEVMSMNKAKSLDLVSSSLKKQERKKLNLISNRYPYSIYDIEMESQGQKKYVIVRFSSTKICYFNLSSNCIRFINSFPEQTEIYFVSDINGTPIIHSFTANDLANMKKTIDSVTYEVRGE